MGGEPKNCPYFCALQNQLVMTREYPKCFQPETRTAVHNCHAFNLYRGRLATQLGIQWLQCLRELVRVKCHETAYHLRFELSQQHHPTLSFRLGDTA